MAGRGHLPVGPWDFMLPDAAVRERSLRYLAAESTPTWCYHSVFRVAEVDGEAGAALCAFEPKGLVGDVFATALADLFARIDRPDYDLGQSATRLVPYSRCFPSMPEGVWIVENVGTREALRRRGLVRALLDDALELGRSAGYREAQISCLIGNEPAFRAYERAGFEVTEEFADTEFEALMGAPGFHRMRLAL